MTLRPESVTTLVAHLDKEFHAIEENWDLNTQAWKRVKEGADHPLDWAALGYTLHAVYTAMENYFLRVSKFFENDLPNDNWHKELLDRMVLNLPGIRPPLLEENTARLIDELRAFRHVFRNLYDDKLDPDRLTLLQKRVPQIRNGFRKAHEGFGPRVIKLMEK